MRPTPKAKQPYLPGLGGKALSGRTPMRAHGGEHSRGRRKVRRPFDPRQALHVVLKSSRARGELSMLHPRHCNHVRDLMDRLKARWNVRVYRYANVGNHLHLLIRAKSRSQWQGFIRELAGGIAMIVTGARKGHALARSGSPHLPESARRGFWDHLVYTRIVAWRRDFDQVADYVCKNLWEAAGVPLRKLIAKGFKVLEISEDGAVLVSPAAAAPPGLVRERALARAPS